MRYTRTRTRTSGRTHKRTHTHAHTCIHTHADSTCDTPILCDWFASASSTVGACAVGAPLKFKFEPKYRLRAEELRSVYFNSGPFFVDEPNTLVKSG